MTWIVPTKSDSNDPRIDKLITVTINTLSSCIKQLTSRPPPETFSGMQCSLLEEIGPKDNPQS